MNCIEARRMVTPYIKKTLKEKDEEQFLKHIEHCSDCMDELDIYFTVYTALDTLDSETHHKEYDFRKLLEEDLKQARKNIVRKRVTRFFRNAFLALVELLLLLCMITCYEMKKSEGQHSTFHRTLNQIHSEYKDRFKRKAADPETEPESKSETEHDQQENKQHETSAAPLEKEK